MSLERSKLLGTHKNIRLLQTRSWNGNVSGNLQKRHHTRLSALSISGLLPTKLRGRRVKILRRWLKKRGNKINRLLMPPVRRRQAHHHQQSVHANPLEVAAVRLVQFEKPPNTVY